MGQQQGTCPRSSSRGRGFASGVSASHNDYIEPIAHPPLSAIEFAVQPCLNATRFLSSATRAHDGGTRSIQDTGKFRGFAMADGAVDTRTARVTAEEALAMHACGWPGKLETR